MVSEDLAVTEDLKKNLMEIIGRVIEMPPAEVSQAFKIVKLAKCFKKDFMKITVSIDPTIEPTIIKAMLQSGLVQKIGKAPAGGMETSIRKHIG